MKRYVKAESKVQEFLRYHDDDNNYASNQSGFDKMYDILEKYDDSNGNDTVDVAFLKATPEDQDKMIELIKPGLKVGQTGYARKLYYDALEEGGEYGKGVVDAIEALFAERLLDESEFRTDL